jgi:hypothetical protein
LLLNEERAFKSTKEIVVDEPCEDIDLHFHWNLLEYFQVLAILDQKVFVVGPSIVKEELRLLLKSVTERLTMIVKLEHGEELDQVFIIIWILVEVLISLNNF